MDRIANWIAHKIGRAVVNLYNCWTIMRASLLLMHIFKKIYNLPYALRASGLHTLALGDVVHRCCQLT